ncbi:MAG: hypothetical protein KIC37_06720 [Coriobacteriaceae bacterium]|nr:hypothetical protein [Coriobacteriaceae bacterium]
MQQGRKRCCLKWAVALAVLLMCVPASPVFAHPINEDDVNSLTTPPETKVLLRRTTKDKGYTFELSAFNRGQSTPGREKDDTSPTYVNIAYLNNSNYNGTARMYVDGAKSKTGSWKNMTVGGYAPILKKGQWCIHNNVKESGYDYARLRGWFVRGSKVTVSGVWSPDSMYSYPSMN